MGCETLMIRPFILNSSGCLKKDTVTTSRCVTQRRSNLLTMENGNAKYLFQAA
ncbi:MAG: hypothetical protein IJV35_04320 [Neisseriaceae bacterium]|nr:hypothetical protein [Neisseriaceae bacterium]